MTFVALRAVQNYKTFDGFIGAINAMHKDFMKRN
jgi:hypothetical protein